MAKAIETLKSGLKIGDCVTSEPAIDYAANVILLFALLWRKEPTGYSTVPVTGPPVIAGSAASPPSSS